jgi:hypothetical protein
MNPKELLVEASILLLRFFWHKAHGADTKPDEAALAEAGRKMAETAAKAAAAEIERKAAEEEMVIATDVLYRAQAQLIEAIHAPSTLPNLLDGADVQLVPAADPSDPKPPG